MVAGAKLSPLLATEIAGNTDEATRGIEPVLGGRMVQSELLWFSLGSLVFSMLEQFFLNSGMEFDGAPWYIICCASR